MKNSYLLLVFLSITGITVAQPQVAMPKVPFMRQLSHENIDKAQKNILHLNGGGDTVFNATRDESINQQLTQMLRVRVDNMQANIEADSTLTESDKFKWLRGLENMLSDFATAYSYQRIKGVLLGDLISAYEDCMQLEIKHKSIYNVIANNEVEVDNILLTNFALKDNKGIKQGKEVVLLKQCQRNPKDILKVLSQNPAVPFADSIIIAEAYRNQDVVYNYAAAPDALGRKIQSSSDPLVRQIGLLAYMKNGRMYFPFLDELYHKRISMDTITHVVNNEEAYYKLLVQTQIDYAGRVRQGDTPMVMKVLTAKLRDKAVEIYINEINALHDSPSDAVRFKKIEKLTPQELYYLCVLGEEDIYTSSYLGVYKRIFERMTVPRSDSLLQSVNNDHYKKFIKMAAAYNTLDDFLKRMDNSQADQVMKSFVNDLDRNNTLEDAVDVADSYASINDPSIRKLILQQVGDNLARVKTQGNKRAQIIYNLLNTVFLSMDSTNKIDISATLGIPPVFMMPNKLLKDSSGRIVVEQFFYGDKDGGNIFSAFLGHFSNANWRIISRPEWVEVRSTKGTPISIYANRPLDETRDLDAQAQQHLNDYLDSLELYPTVVIHRGHSYYLSSTIKQLAPSARLILLGSCGGYQSLNTVLSICPEAQIISSKQTGTGIINQGMINVITEKLRSGQDLNWPLLWKGFEKTFSGQTKEKFDDYVPPHKNLGAIFIMAYNKSAAENS